MSGNREKPALPWEKPIPQQIKVVFVRRCSPFYTAEEGRTRRKFGKKKDEGKTITHPVSMDSCPEPAYPYTTGTAVRPCHSTFWCPCPPHVVGMKMLKVQQWHKQMHKMGHFMVYDSFCNPIRVFK